MKSKIIAGVGIVVLAIALIFAMKPKSFDKQFEKKMSDMNSYILEGNMEIAKGEDVKTYAVEVGYKKADKDFFKFEGDWPMNSPKPYLLQSISDIVKGKDAAIKEEKGGYLVTSKVSYPNNKNFDHEEIMFDKDSKLKWLQIYNKDNTSELKIVFTKSDYNAKIKDDYFKAPTVLEKSKATSAITAADLPLYPVMVYDAKLENISSMNANGQTKHVLEYTGDKNFTVVETKKESVKETQTVIMPGEMMDALDVVGFYDGNHLSAVYDNVEFTVFSVDLSPEEMMQVIMSMQVAVMK